MLNRQKLLFVFLISVALCAFTSSGNITNTVPYTNTFETSFNTNYVHGYNIYQTDGWYCEPSVSNDVISISTNWANWTNTYTGLTPVPSATHSNVAKIIDSVTNLITQPIQKQDVYIDMMILPSMWESTQQPPTNGNEKFGIYFNTNMNPVVFVAYPTAFSGVWPGTNVWLTMTNFTASTSEWLRVTIFINWEGAAFASDDWVMLKLNGVQISDDYGRVGVRNSTTPGPWFLCPNRAPDALGAIAFAGNALIDDLVAVTNDPFNTVMYSVNMTVTPGNSAEITPGNIKSAGSRSYASNSVSGPSFVFTNLPNYFITNTCINGTNFLGPTATNFTFPNITQNCSIVVMSKGKDVGVIVSNVSDSAGLSDLSFSSPSPSGSNTYAFNSSATFTIDGSPHAINSRTQAVCTGWTATGSGEFNGYVTNNTFTVNQYTTLTWHWKYKYLLETIAFGHGSISPSNGWFVDGSLCTLTATEFPPDGAFVGWEGETNDCTITGNQLTIPSLSGSRRIEARFSGGATARGTDYDYLLQYYPTNYQMEVADEWDTDLDGFKTWEEYITGTDPTDASSKFKIIGVGTGNGSNFVTFYGTTNSGVTRPFGMRLITNMLSSANWTNWTPMEETFMDRSADGTNTFWYSPGPGTNSAFYIPVATN